MLDNCLDKQMWLSGCFLKSHGICHRGRYLCVYFLLRYEHLLPQTPRDIAMEWHCDELAQLLEEYEVFLCNFSFINLVLIPLLYTENLCTFLKGLVSFLMLFHSRMSKSQRETKALSECVFNFLK